MSRDLPPGYDLSLEIPSLADYQRLRSVAGLSRFAEVAARKGLPGTVIGAVVRYEGRAVGMGRIVGDGGLFFQMVDIAVEPAHQGSGLGKAIVRALLQALAERLDAPAYVSLVADGAADRLYAQFGFVPVAPKSQGVARWLQPSSSSAG
jgi:ribosomal protein S18 acetylase RimI-like enzyme